MTPGSAVIERVRLRPRVRHGLVLVHDVLDRHRPSGLERPLEIGQELACVVPSLGCLRLRRREDDAIDPREQSRGLAHRARLRARDEAGTVEASRTEAACCGPDRRDLRVRGRVVVGDILVHPLADNAAAEDNDGPERAAARRGVLGRELDRTSQPRPLVHRGKALQTRGS